MSVNIQANGKSGNIEMREIAIELLDPCDWNPNKMNKDKFNALFDNISEHGMLEPIVVRPLPNGRYEIIGGHHRLEVCKILEYTHVPCIIKHGMTDFDVECQNMRLNVIKGAIDPEKFTKMFMKMQAEFPDRDIATELGIVSQDELNRMILAARADLPEEMKNAFDKAKKEIKTLDDLVLVINDLFTRQGDTLEKFNYMILDFDGKDSIWIRMHKPDIKSVEGIKELCFKYATPLDDVIRKMMSDLLKSTTESKDIFFSGLPKVDLTGVTLPTEEGIAQAIQEAEDGINDKG